MTVVRRQRRKMTAREAAERLGVSVRTIQNYMAEDRADYLDRAKDRRAKILELHRAGVKGAVIARELGISEGLVSIRIKQAREAGELVA